MQKPADLSLNRLLSQTIRFLHGEEDNFENIKSLLERSTINHLSLTFSFLINWLSNHLIDDSMSETYSDTIQSVFQLISLIIKKVPPVILYHQLPENIIESADCSHWLINELLEPIKKRIMKLRSYIKPSEAFDLLCIIQPVFYQNNEGKGKFRDVDNYLRVEKDVNPNLESLATKYMKCLIMNHVPVQFFKMLSSIKKSRLLLTNAIIKLLEELNQTREATHEQLLFAFSSIFLYIYQFSFNNEIDGETLCEYLKSRAFLSPFCLLGMVKYIISYLYLFNLLIPNQCICDNTTEIPKSSKSRPYTYVDLTSDTKLTPLIQKLPLILTNYFYTKSIKKENELNNNGNDDLKDDIDFHIFIHLSNTEIQSKMRSVIVIAKDKLLTPVHVYSMGLLLLRYISISLQINLVVYVKKDMFTPNFSTFVKNFFSILTTTFSEQISSKFFDLSISDPDMINFALGGTFIHLLPVILRSQTQNRLIKFCLKAIDDKDLAPKGRIIISKLLLCDSPKSSPELIAKIKETKDLVTLLNYIDALTNYQRVRNFKEAMKIEESRLDLLNQLIIGNTHSNENSNNTPKSFIFTPFKALSTINRQFNSLSISIIKAFESPNQINSMNELLCNSNDVNQPWIILSFALTACIENESFSETITNHIINELNKKEQKQPTKGSRFEVGKNDHYYVVSQSLLRRLVSFSYIKQAIKLSQAMIPYLSKDLAALHYITSFLAKYRSICPIGVLESFTEVVSNLPCASEYYELGHYSDSTSLSFGVANVNHSHLINKVFAISEILIANSCKIIQNPDVVTQEYQSPFQHAMAFAICILALSTSNQNQDNLNNSSSTIGINNSSVNEIGDTSLNIISNSFDFDAGQGSSFYNPYMEFGTNFDAGTNFDTPTSFNAPTTFDLPTPKPSTNPNEIVPDSITNDIAEALLSPATCFTRFWPQRESSVKLCAMLAAQMDDKIATKYLDLVINGTNSELFILAGRIFLLNANLNILEYACQSLTNYIANFNLNFSNQGMNDNDLNIKIDFFFKIITPSVWRIQGNNRVGLILLDGILKCITKKTPKKLFNTAIDIISYVYLKLELFNERNLIIASASKAGYTPEMLILLQSILPTTP